MTSPPTARKLPPKRVLVVDDEPLVASTIRMLLTISGHTADIAEDGEKALTMFSAANHDLVITDFSLPGMDGLELAKAVKQQAPTTPIILVTAYAERVRNSMGKVSNIDVLIGKPFSIDRLQSALLEVFPEKTQ